MMTERGRFGSAMSLAGDDGESKLCQKKQVLIDKFNALLAKLGVNFEQANHTMSQVRKEWMDAMDAWLDAESAYRLGEQRAKEAREGAKFATDEYEKWAQANKAARKSLAETLARHGKDRADLLNEKALIKEIMRLIGVLHDVKATEKSIAAGGRDSVKDAESGVSDPYNIKMSRAKAQLHEKVVQLKQLTLHTKVGVKDSEKLALLSRQSLAVYSETEEVAGILKQMLKDLDQRVAVLDELDAKANQEVTDTYGKMVEWEKKMVALANQADRAQASIQSSEDEREALTATKRLETQTYTEEKVHYDLTVNPFENEIRVIMLIKQKIIDHCASEAAERAASAP
eukprot:Tamp_06729.p2 GENE.Tamp_06729~~Tamp_06729.p2  ORF type:complete len:372 (-),score=125.43 Tamp_06729:1530-2558(-)